MNIRNKSIALVNNLSSSATKKDPINEHLDKLIKQTALFLKVNDNIILTRADKGNITVALDRNKYIKDIEEMLQEGDNYTRIKKDPTKIVIVSLRRVLMKWKKLEYISASTHGMLSNSDGLLPRAYGLPKVHKPNCPFRIIISSINSPLHAFATYIQKIISINIPTAQSRIDNSFDLVKKLTGVHIDDGFSLISLDVVALFTNIPIDLALKSLENRWNFIGASCNIPKDEFLGAVRLILDSTYFSFNNLTYKQNFGTPMGSPLSPVIADMVMQDLECS